MNMSKGEQGCKGVEANLGAVGGFSFLNYFFENLTYCERKPRVDKCRCPCWLYARAAGSSMVTFYELDHQLAQPCSWCASCDSGGVIWTKKW
jgi:hypothetical protein